MTTTDEAGLLAAVLLRPDDDAPRQMLADLWMESDDEATRARGEFVAVQLELAALEAAVHRDRQNAVMGGCCDRFADQMPCDCLNTPAMRALRERERELWLDNVDRWFGRELGHVALTGPNETEMRNGHSVGVLERGWVSRWYGTLGAFLGEPCPVCNGAGDLGTLVGRMGCTHCSAGHDCRGTGRTEGVAARLFAAHPVERVTLVDREPWSHHPGSFQWGLTTRQTTNETDVTDLAYACDRHNIYLDPGPHPTREAALSALSDAACRYGRELAGLTKGGA